MATYNQLKTRAEQVRDEQTIGGNTALRVGQLLYDMIEKDEENSDSIDNLSVYYTGTQDNPIIETLNNLSGLHWLQSPIVALVSMGEDLDGDSGAVVQEGDLYYYNHSGFQIFVKGSGGSIGVGYKARKGVLFINKYTGKFYEWTGSFMSEITIPGSGGGGGGGGDITVVAASAGDFEIADEAGNVILRLADGHIQTKEFDSSQLDGGGSQTKSLKIFFVGNSFSMDAAAYAPFIISAMNAGIQLTIGCSYVGGCSLQTHLSNLTNDTAAYAYYKSVNGGAWSSASSQKMSTMLADEAWDVVVLQQNSDNAGDYDTIGGTNDYLGGCITQIVTRLGRTPKFWWLLTQRKTSVAYTYDMMLSIAQRVALEYPIGQVIPVGAAVELARGTTLDALGSSSHLQADNNGHLQEGLPVLLAGYAFVMTILHALGIDGSVIGNTYTLTTSPTPAAQQNGSVVGVTDANRRIAQHCAVVADNNNDYKF